MNQITDKVGQMVQLYELLGKRSLLKLLSWFTEHPSGEFSFTELHKKTNLAKATLASGLFLLQKGSWIKMRSLGSTNLYSLERENPLVKQFKILNVISSLQPLKKITSSKIYLYGSAARGEEKEESDIDLLVIGEVKEELICRQIISFLPKIKKEIKIQVFRPLEWAEMEVKDSPFYERVEKDKIQLN